MKTGKWYLVIGAVLLLGASCNRTTPVPTIGIPEQNMIDSGAITPPTNGQVIPETLPVESVKTVVVQYTGSEFSPKTTTLNIGDTVMFRNVGQGAAVWPAANPHPIHTSVPGFDSGQPIDTGGTYSFTFNTAQTVQYHNHLNPSETGTIIVK